ncbi:MAG: 3'-5' exonuclease [Acidiferrobacterales bacterium]|nr:3'-5' exonuclease [Acidiferrobacterales bacterium]
MLIAFDIETIPDLEGGRKLFDLDGIDDKETAKAMLAARREKVANADFLPLHQHRVVAISLAARWGKDQFGVRTLGDIESDEKEIVQKFFNIVEKSPTLISWNGNGFDLPVLQYRAMIHSIPSVTYWDTGKFNSDFKWSNYQSRYHNRHVDLMDILSRYQPRACAPLGDICKLIGLPGKLGVGGSNVFDAYLEGDLQGIRDYCEIDALTTFLVYLRFELIRGIYTEQRYENELQLVRNWLSESDAGLFQQFLSAWKPNN